MGEGEDGGRLAAAAEVVRGLRWLLPRLCGWRPGRRRSPRVVRDGRILEVRSREAPGGVRLARVVYGSDGLAVVGYRLDPADVGPRPPVVLYLRGGLGPHGELAGPDFLFLAALASRTGATILAPQYRGNEGGDGEDQGGEAEAADAVRLLDAAGELGPVPRERLGALGYSRGGTTALMAMRRGFGPRALATIGCITDTVAARAEGSWLLASAIHVGTGGHPHRRAEAYRIRSPLHWVDELPPVPLTAIVGTADEVVGPWQSRRLVEALVRAGRPARLIEVPGGDHKLDQRPAERLALASGWVAEALGDPGGAGTLPGGRGGG